MLIQVLEKIQKNENTECTHSQSLFLTLLEQLGWAGLKDGAVSSMRESMGFEVRSSSVQICMLILACVGILVKCVAFLGLDCLISNIRVIIVVRCSVVQLYLTLCNPMDCSTPDFPVLHYLPESTQSHVH